MIDHKELFIGSWLQEIGTDGSILYFQVDIDLLGAIADDPSMAEGIPLTDFYWQKAGLTPLPHIIYLHQLQNLCRALNGAELEIHLVQLLQP